MVKILTERLGDFMRDSFHTVMRAFRAFDAEGKGFIEVDVLKQIMGEVRNSKEEPCFILILSYVIIDSRAAALTVTAATALLTLSSLHILTNSQGDEALSDQEVEEMIASCIDDGTGRIYYEDYAYLLAMDGRDM
jgi:Ca2+-binding EF-hand superfamily protein